MHRERKRLSFRVSLETRCPHVAQRLSKLLVLAEHSALTRATHVSMRYDEIRRHVQQHFRELLLAFKGDIEADGPPDAQQLNALRATEGRADGDPETWRAMTIQLTLALSWAISAPGETSQTAISRRQIASGFERLCGRDMPVWLPKH
jgi:hypothetical protein